MPQISVYLPTRNIPELLDRAVKSVLCQDFEDFELIIVDDGSDQNVVNRWRDDRIRIISNTQNLGSPRSRNRAIISARGRFISGLDDDDVFLPSRLSSFLKAWQSLRPLRQILPVAGLFDSALVLPAAGAGPVVRHTASVADSTTLRRRNEVGSQIFAPTTTFVELGGYDPEMPAWQDWELWYRLSATYGCLLNIHATTMIIDESHRGPRITMSDPSTIRAAERRFTAKAGVRRCRERAEVRLATLAYPTVNPTLSDLLLLLRAGRLRHALHALRRQ